VDRDRPVAAVAATPEGWRRFVNFESTLAARAPAVFAVTPPQTAARVRVEKGVAEQLTKPGGGVDLT
jgi:hypothetical protein